MEEEWRNVEGYYGEYLVSNLGRVKSMKLGRERVMVSSHTTGYAQLSLCSEGERRYVYVHDLVCYAFFGSKPDRFTVNHKDGNKTNNSVNNLEYVTYSCNNAHAYNSGFKSSGEKHYLAILTEDDVRSIRDRLSNKDKSVDIAEKYGVSSATISLIKSGKNWKQLS